MSFKAASLVWERSRAKGSGLLIMLAIADYAMDNGRGAYPSTPTLARKSRMTQRAVYQVLSRLEAEGELTTTYDPKKSRRYLHIRCIYDAANFVLEAKPAADDGDEEFAAPANFAGGVNPPEVEVGVQSLQGQTTDSPCKPCIPPLNVAAHPPAKSGVAYKEDPISDPVIDPLTGLGFIFEARPVEKPAMPVLIKLAHAVLDARDAADTGGGRPDLVDNMKTRCALAQLTYDTAAVERALDSAIWQRMDR